MYNIAHFAINAILLLRKWYERRKLAGFGRGCLNHPWGNEFGSWSRDFVSETKTAEIINSRITVITDPEPISLWLSWPSLPRPPTVNPLILADHSCARTLALTNTRALLYLSLLPSPAWPWRQNRRAQPWNSLERTSALVEKTAVRGWYSFVFLLRIRFSRFFRILSYWEFPRQKRRKRIKCNGSILSLLPSQAAFDRCRLE